MGGPTRTGSRAGPGPGLLGIYLNDHLAGATVGVELARRVASAHRGGPDAPVLDELAGQIADDRAALLEMITALGIPVRHYKIWAAWVAEKAGRLKFNGRAVNRSPLSSLVELEMLRLGVEGKAAGWITLRAIADKDRRLIAERLDELISKARRQSETLEDLRARTVAEVFAAG